MIGHMIGYMIGYMIVRTPAQMVADARDVRPCRAMGAKNHDNQTLRLDRLLARGCGMTRGEAAKLVRRGQVQVDGETVKSTSHHVAPTVAITIHGVAVPVLLEVHLMLHKPAGVLSATRDASHRTVLDLVPERWRREALSPVGRLDKDTTGLLLLTTDGQLVHDLTHPKRHVAKVYDVRFAGPLDPDAVERFRAGMTLKDGTHTAPATLELLDEPGHARVTLSEGRYHQVKRMLAACGGKVVELHRRRIGGLGLDPTLEPGACRLVTPAELALARGVAAADER